MKRALGIAALLAVFAVQWAVPAVMLQRHQTVVEQGTAYRFRTAPVDPVDPFRGRYVRLRFAASEIAVPLGVSYPHDTLLYAPITVNDVGFATLAPPLLQPPEGDYLQVRVVHRLEPKRLRVALPFDRYYMEERLAPEAERHAREAMRRDSRTSLAPSWAVVRVLDGRSVLTRLFIDGVPVRERIEQARAAASE